VPPNGKVERPPDKRRGRTLSPGARGAQPPTPHGPLQRIVRTHEHAHRKPVLAGNAWCRSMLANASFSLRKPRPGADHPRQKGHAVILDRVVAQTDSKSIDADFRHARNAAPFDQRQQAAQDSHHVLISC
jgi:hypothetical protein